MSRICKLRYNIIYIINNNWISTSVLHKYDKEKNMQLNYNCVLLRIFCDNHDSGVLY